MTATTPNSEKNNQDSTQISINQGGQIRSLGYSWSMESKVVIRKPKRKTKDQNKQAQTGLTQKDL